MHIVFFFLFFSFLLFHFLFFLTLSCRNGEAFLVMMPEVLPYLAELLEDSNAAVCMYVLYVCMLCMYACMSVCMLCMLCMYVMYIMYVWIVWSIIPIRNLCIYLFFIIISFLWVVFGIHVSLILDTYSTIIIKHLFIIYHFIFVWCVWILTPNRLGSCTEISWTNRATLWRILVQLPSIKKKINKININIYIYI